MKVEFEDEKKLPVVFKGKISVINIIKKAINNPDWFEGTFEKNKALIKFISKNKTNENISIDNVNHNFEYISIEVICDGIIKILKNKIKHKYINFYGNKINILSLLMKIKRILNSDSKIIIKKLIKRKSDLKKSKTLNYKVNKNDLFYSKLRLIIGNEIKNKWKSL